MDDLIVQYNKIQIEIAVLICVCIFIVGLTLGGALHAAWVERHERHLERVAARKQRALHDVNQFLQAETSLLDVAPAILEEGPTEGEPDVPDAKRNAAGTDRPGDDDAARIRKPRPRSPRTKPTPKKTPVKKPAKKAAARKPSA